MGMMKDRIIEAMDARNVDELPEGWYVVDSSFHIGAGPFKTEADAAKRIVLADEQVIFI